MTFSINRTVTFIFLFLTASTVASASDVPNIPVEWTTLTTSEPPGASTGPTLPPQEQWNAIVPPGAINIWPLLNPPENPPIQAMVAPSFELGNGSLTKAGESLDWIVSDVPNIPVEWTTLTTSEPPGASTGPTLPPQEQWNAVVPVWSPVNPTDPYIFDKNRFSTLGNAHSNPNGDDPRFPRDFTLGNAHSTAIYFPGGVNIVPVFNPPKNPPTLAKVDPSFDPGIGYPIKVGNPRDWISKVNPSFDSGNSLPNVVMDRMVTMALVPEGAYGGGSGSGIKGPKGPPSIFGL